MLELEQRMLSLNPEEPVDIESTKEVIKLIGEGARRAETAMRKVVLGEKVGGKRLGFNEELINKIQSLVLFYTPGHAGVYRIDDETRIGNTKIATASELPSKMYMFGLWLEDQMSRFSADDLPSAIKIAAATHHGLTTIHPFENGNGRTARILVNGILVSGTEELLVGRYVIPPIPSLRSAYDILQLQRDIEAGKEIKIEPYLKAIIDAIDSLTLKPLEVYFASIWRREVITMLESADVKINRKDKNHGYRDLRGVLKRRLGLLDTYLEEYTSNKRDPNLIPNYFAPRHVKFDNAKVS